MCGYYIVKIENILLLQCYNYLCCVYFTMYFIVKTDENVITYYDKAIVHICRHLKSSSVIYSIYLFNSDKEERIKKEGGETEREKSIAELIPRHRQCSCGSKRSLFCELFI